MGCASVRRGGPDGEMGLFGKSQLLPAFRVCQGFAFKVVQMALSRALILSKFFSYLTFRSLNNDLEEGTRRRFPGNWKLIVASFIAFEISLAGESGGFNHPLPLLLALFPLKLAAVVSFGQAFHEEEPPSEKLDTSAG